ncbi:hypothetical protein V5O48_005797 [Marasmius crinis-equi]|uniref:Uncharacterized protein n=1 Tax=Marasmius crinis-equi TaxID=585013 RepID=A0ABR3FLB6_9AGAR
MLLTFQETPQGPLCTIQLADGLRSTQIASLVQLLVVWRHLQSIVEPEHGFAEFGVELVDKQAQQMAEAVARLRTLLEEHWQLREMLWTMLALYLLNKRGGQEE